MRRALADALATPDLRRLQLAWACAAVGGWIFMVALAVHAYHVGGATAVGLAALVRMVPAGLAAPALGLLGDRFSRRDVLLVTSLAGPRSSPLRVRRLRAAARAGRRLHRPDRAAQARAGGAAAAAGAGAGAPGGGERGVERRRQRRLRGRSERRRRADGDGRRGRGVPDRRDDVRARGLAARADHGDGPRAYAPGARPRRTRRVAARPRHRRPRPAPARARRRCCPRRP